MIPHKLFFFMKNNAEYNINLYLSVFKIKFKIKFVKNPKKF